MKCQYRSRSFWCRGYYVDTVGKNTEKISIYIIILWFGRIKNCILSIPLIEDHSLRWRSPPNTLSKSTSSKY